MDLVFTSTLFYQSAGLLISAVAGLLLYSMVLWFVRRQRNLRVSMLFEPITQAVAAGIIGFSCFALVYPLLPTALDFSLPLSREGFFILAGSAAGIGLVGQANYFFDEMNSNAATAAMFAHSAMEGMGLGLMINSPQFQTIFKSQVIHGVPEGMLMAMMSLERSGISKTMISLLTTRLGFVAMFYITAKYIQPIPKLALWSAEGVALGSMLAMAWMELVKPAMRALGKPKAFTIITVTSVLCSYAFG